MAPAVLHGVKHASPARSHGWHPGSGASTGGRARSGAGLRSTGVAASPWAGPQAWNGRGGAHSGDLDDALSDAYPPERGCGAGYDLHMLEIQNSRLRRKLTRTRVRSQERVSRAERRLDELGSENMALQRECESLRSLFIRQQQQQIAFWTGPFMEMLAEKDRGAAKHSLARSLRSGDRPQAMLNGTTATAARAAAAMVQGGGWSDSLSQTAASKTAEGDDDASDPDSVARAECLKALKRERDYWRSMATGLKREMHAGDPSGGAPGGAALGGDVLGGSLREIDDLRDLEGTSEGTAGGAASGCGMCSSSSSSAGSLPCTPSGVAAATGPLSAGGAWPPVHAQQAACSVAPVPPPLPPAVASGAAGGDGAPGGPPAPPDGARAWRALPAATTALEAMWPRRERSDP
eukprot:CAMPEP_0176042232 /NCGR_PEP_ID=MMETSP0120_2-20121206/20954_1 /TAXON_ID=160619 /ORGANISM="Kryptoperidinium foliaceum, Strain CCMP 1326" /LENGTH=405 /DNA_ID=CAMNT_0017375641 /DNA_START=17 /DNA_END=1232 /DNA_ORIENTATION=-